MQTFLPYVDFSRSAAVLDRQRLGKQRVEALQIIKALTAGGGWSNHPAVKMWSGYELALIDYGLTVCREWIDRGYQDSCTEQLLSYQRRLRRQGYATHSPHWLGSSIHRTHRSNLLRKYPGHYRQYWPRLRDDLPYYWPSND